MLLTTPEYAPGVAIIPYVVAGVLVFGLQQSFQSGFLFYKKTHVITCMVVISAVFDLILNLIFIPRFGYMGAAVTTLVSYCFLLILMVGVSRKVFIWKFPVKSLINSLLASIPIAMILYFANKYYAPSFKGVIILTMVSAVVYLFVLTIIHEFSIAEINLFKQFTLGFSARKCIKFALFFRKGR